MWNPGNFDNEDFGLVDGEAFEPSDGDDADTVDLDQPHVMTVLGPISPEDLGICLPHAHLLANPSAMTDDEPGLRLDSLHLACNELEAWVLTGGQSIVDAATRGYGRDINGLVTIAQRIPAHVIAATGRQTAIHAEKMDDPLDTERPAEEFIQEITFGAGRSGVHPGVVAFATTGATFTPVEESAARAAIRAAIATGVPISTESDHSTGTSAHLEMVEKEGGDPGRTILCGQDRTLDDSSLLNALNRGAWCSFDQMGRPFSKDDVDVARMIVGLAEAGYANQLLVSEDLPRTSMQNAYGGSPGLVHVLDRFTVTLMAAGASGELVHSLLIDNPARALTVVPANARST